MKPEGDPRHSGSWPASHAPAKAPPHKECAGGKTVSLEHWENQQECPSHTSVIVQWGTESLIPPCTVSINKKKKKKTSGTMRSIRPLGFVQGMASND